MIRTDQTSIDLFDPNVQEDWFPTYRRLRHEAPVFQIPGTSTYVVSRYADVMHVLRHQNVFPSGTGVANRHSGAARIYEARGWERMTPLSVNPPEHREYRRLVDHHFSATGSALYAESMQRVIDELIEEFVDRGHVDFMAAFAVPFPVRMITRILGFPDEDIDRLKAWSAAWVLPFAGGLTEEQHVMVAKQVVELQAYIQERLDEKRANPGDDVLSQLAVARFRDERPLTDPEIISIIDHLYIGGNETTTFALTSALWILLREPGLYERVRDDRSLVTPFLEESLRLESPTQGLYRRVASDTEIGGVALAEGATVHIRYAAANRDETVFPEPEQVNLDRPNLMRHMAFSLGEHHCPGEGLSRLEQRLALNTILDRLPHLRLSANNDFTHAPGFVLRSLHRLNVEWTID